MTDSLANDLHVVLEQEIVSGVDRTGQSILDRHDAVAGFATDHGIEEVLECVPRQKLRVF